VKRLAATVRAGLVALVLAPIRVYRLVISPGLPRRCKYEPTCAAYAEQAIRELGVARGLVLALWRLARCNPWSHGGYDPVEARTILRPTPSAGADPPAPLSRSSEGTMAR
jgi:putative membrane protein insertion efficiency factor